MKNNTWKKYMGITAITAVLLVGSVSAYFTDQDEKTNTFTVGKVTIDLEEPEWDKKPDEKNMQSWLNTWLMKLKTGTLTETIQTAAIA